MSRFASIIPMDEFKKKVQRIIEVDDFQYHLPTKIQKDFDKVNFDWENCDFLKDEENYDNPCDYPCGIETLENGLHVWFLKAGGDGEHAICLCIYWDGKSLRGYIPEDGNVYNKKQKCAFGSEYEENDANIDYSNLPKINPEAIRKDIMSRIQIR